MDIIVNTERQAKARERLETIGSPNATVLATADSPTLVADVRRDLNRLIGLQAMLVFVSEHANPCGSVAQAVRGKTSMIRLWVWLETRRMTLQQRAIGGERLGFWRGIWLRALTNSTDRDRDAMDSMLALFGRCI